MKLPKVIYVMGPPGAGKGTQAELLANAISYQRFSTGSAFREVSQQQTELGQRVKNLIDNGILAPPPLAAEIVMNAVREHIRQGEGLIFDGTPRTIEEAEIIDRFFAQQGIPAPLAIYIEVDRDEMIRRNSKRHFCLGLTNDFPVMNDADATRCVAAGGTVGSRPDDDPAKFATRWNEFQQRTWPVIERYGQEGKLQKVEGMKSIAEVHADIMGIVDTFER